MSALRSEVIDLRHGRFQDFTIEGVDQIVTDPPYNIGFQGYNSYADNLPDDEYIDMLSSFQNMPVALIQYPEEMARWVVPALGPYDYCGAWCYNGNIPRRFRLIGYWGCRPEYSRIKQPYKNPTDKRVKKLIENGSEGTPLYEWWSDIQLVKNVSKEKTSHPCPIPVELAERIITLTTEAGDTVMDPFMGSGTVALACFNTGRNFVGCEIDEGYFREAQTRVSKAMRERGMSLSEIARTLSLPVPAVARILRD